MSASSQSLGLAESQDFPVTDAVRETTANLRPFEMEDPACAWIDLVECIQGKVGPSRNHAVNKMLVLAKHSHWTMEKWIAFGTGYASDSDTEPFDPFEPIHEDECECEGCFATRANDQETLAKNGAAEGLVAIGAGPLPKLARTCVTARQAGVYCPFCGQWMTARDFLDHTC